MKVKDEAVKSEIANANLLSILYFTSKTDIKPVLLHAYEAISAIIHHPYILYLLRFSVKPFLSMYLLLLTSVEWLTLLLKSTTN